MIPEIFPPFIYEVSSLSKLFWKEFVTTFHADALFEKFDKLPGFPSFTAEVFHRLYYDPEPEKLDPRPPESAWAEKLHDEFSSLIGFENLIQQCEGNQLAAGIATMEFCEGLLERLPQPRHKLKDPQKLRNLVKHLKNNPQHPRQVLDESFQDEILSVLTQFDREEREEIEKLIESADGHIEQSIEQLQDRGRESVRDAQEYADRLDESQIRGTLRETISQTEQKLEEVTSWLEMMGLSWGQESGTMQIVSPLEKMLLVQKISSHQKLKQIASLAGRLKDIASRKRRTRSDNSFGELSTIELGNNLARLIPSELQKLADPSLFPLFAQGYYDRSLIQYKITGKEKKSKGALVVCLDSSRSMRGMPDTWAKAVAAVLAQIARNEHRHFRVIHFDSKVQRIDNFPPKHHDYNLLLESMLSFYSGGGTDWSAALSEALKCIEQDKSFQNADIVMITDGKCKLEPDFLNKLKQQKEQKGLSIFSILIGTHSQKMVAQFSDRLWVIQNLHSQADTEIEELFLI